MVALKNFRRNHKLTQKQIAESIGIDQRQWSRYENGQNEIPVRYIIAICEKYRVSADEVLEITFEPIE